MPRTLYAKLSLALAALLLSVGVLYTLLSLSSVRYYLQETEQKLNLDLAKNLVADRNLVESGKLNQKALSATFMEYMVINPSIEIYLLDLQGNILSYSADPGKVKRHSVSLTPIRKFLNGAKLPLLGDDPRSHDRQKIFSVTPVPSAEQPQGYLYVVLRGEEYDNTEQFIKQSLIWKQSGWALAASLLLGLFAGLLLFRRLTQRLNQLSNEMDTFRQGDFTSFVTTTTQQRSHDEIDELGNTFNQMAQRITRQLEALKQQDSLRRELVANVSHDLRTPVAILHGYLETLELKSNQLSQDEKERYLKQALQSSERLNQLISELFELAKLEAQESVPEQEQFNLAELAHDVVQKFQLKAQEKNITLALDASNENLFACADIGLIARLFENLLGNALKFTPNGGRVTVKLSMHDNKPMIAIQDSGPGIATDEQDKVFDRFYQGKENGNRAKPGGLGLAIAKRIIDLHGGSINVSSKPGQGTTFNVLLPTA
jgi:two-component system OmpR family sensor kinase